ncbi:hypothetical protein ASPVEDRAFT_812838 [Aspergillus versicolor CBS 583.65]|uniref:Uncharacterized protein n=1 Tax=Aspergillus versicolor CBS 583.65 TaxID=1036611 RepID=A0A1L9PTK6_ASPVE|nr:uncharacterized protein ASPVEDRAFT_812838 [Aspergillus versicolor CBS 583.65]OJJ04765.1 hypothetical protein ASPVEDRAFT_812838 [Aspergillus versicolor CBS 583.65]
MAPFSPVLFCDLEQNAREVFVSPFLWTSHHFDILGCRFEDVGIPTSSIELTQSKCNTEENIKIRKERELDTQKLAEKSQWRSKPRLSSLYPFGIGSGFFFAGIRAHRPYSTVFYRHGDPKNISVKAHLFW